MATEKKDAEYLLAETGREIERLKKQYAWIQTVLKDKIVFVPVDIRKQGLKVLDMGCADGTLLRDLQKQVPASADLVGADLMPSFLPQENPSGNIRYIVQNVVEPLPIDLQGTFELVHVRFMLAGAGPQTKAAVKNLVDGLTPGGWIQIFELDVSQDHPSDPQAMKDLQLVLSTLFKGVGIASDYALELSETYKDLGLEDVNVERVDLPIGVNMDNEADAHNSIVPFEITIPSVIMGCERTGGKLPASVTENLQERFVQDAMKHGGYFRGVVVTGRKKI